MKQPKDDDRPLVLSKKITKGQHIIPAHIIKKWKQDVIITENCPFDIEFRKGKEDRLPQSERSECFCVYHRWTQNVEKWKEKIEKDFYKLVGECESECEKLQSNIITIDNGDQKKQKIVLNYFNTIMTCNYFKYQENNSYVKLNLLLSDTEEQMRQQRVIQQEKEGFNREYCEKLGFNYLDIDSKTDISGGVFLVNVYVRTSIYVDNNKDDPRATWYYIKTKERLYLPDCYKPYKNMNYENVGIINVSPHSILISRYFIDTYLRRISEANHFDLSQLDIVNPPADCKNVISFVKIINKLALMSYDKWLIR